MKQDVIIEKLQTMGKDRFLLLFLAGLMLVIIAMPMEKKEAKKEPSAEEMVLTEKETEKETDMETYREQLCQQLEEFLRQMEGVGQAKVYITMHSTKEIIVERNSPYRKQTEEEIAQDKTRMTAETENESEVVLVTEEDGSQTPIVVKEIAPVVSGVVVAAQGGGNEKIKNEITALVMALFGIEEHKIRVVKLST